jgi:hypothetical protein
MSFGFIRYGAAVFPDVPPTGPIARDIAAHIAYETERRGGVAPHRYEVSQEVWDRLAHEKAYTGSLTVCGVPVCVTP